MADQKSSLDIKLKKADRIYHPGDTVEGTVVVNAFRGWSHNGINLLAEGVVHTSSTSRGIMGLGTEYSGKQIQMFKVNFEICGAGKFADGITEIPFEFVLKPSAAQAMVESYHGVYISAIYYIQVTCDRGMMKKALNRDTEFIVEVPSGKSSDPSPASYDITPESLENVTSDALSSIPKFKITGRLHRSNYPIHLPFTGEVIVQSSNSPVRSIELQLVRVESVLANDNTFVREATEVQNIQIAEGNVCRDMVVPLYMVFPRLFSCASVVSTQFKVEFEVNLIIIFMDGYIITENFPITLSREK